MPITDLTNTIWAFNETGCSGYGTDDTTKTFHIDFTCDNKTLAAINAPYIYRDLYRLSTIQLGASYFYLRTTDYIYTQLNLTDGEGWYSYDTQVYTKMSEPPTITITGGTDVTNPDLITWLEQNATRIIPTKTFDLSTLQLADGTHTIQVKARAAGYRDSNFSNSVSYEVSPPSGYQVTISNGLSSASLYDGQDNTGIFLGTILSGETKTYTITSGWIYLDANGYSLYDEDGQIQGNPFEIVGDTTLIVTGAGSND